MAKTYNRLEIDVNKKPNSIGIRPVQHDTKSRYLDVCLYENGVAINLTGEQVRITFRKADGSTFFNQGEVTDATAGRCQFALTNEILSEAKAVEAQISVWNAGGEVLSTQVFEIYVTAAIPWTDSVESENEYGVLVVLFQEIQDALDTMHKIATTFGEPGDKAAEYGVDTFWGILEMLAQRGDVESVLEKIKVFSNSTVDTTYFNPLDKLSSAKIMCRGRVGTNFTITSKEGLCEPLKVSITDNSFDIDTSDRMKMEAVPVPLGEYSAEIELQGLKTTADVDVTVAGKPHYFAYSLFTSLKKFTSDGTYTVPNLGIFDLLVSAAGGGAGGSGGHGSNGSGGPGGGGGACIYLNKIRQSVGTNIKITIGSGGTGGKRGYSGSNGGATVVGDIVTIPGGESGSNPSTNGSTGGKGGTPGGGSGGVGGTGNSNDYPTAGENSIIPGGDGGAAFSSAYGGGGGGGSYGNGGNGGDANNNGSAGTLGGGGGGGGYGGIGGSGGSGIVEFLKGVVVA